MNSHVKTILKNKFGKVKVVPGKGYRIPCPTCDPNHSRKMKRYITVGWSFSNCFICNQLIPVDKLFDYSADLTNAPVENDEQEYKYAKILPYQEAIKTAELEYHHPAIKFLTNDHLHNFQYYDSLGIRYIPSQAGIDIKFESGYTVNTAESLFFPVFDVDNNYVGWQLRFIPGTQNGGKLQFMRYMHLFPKGDHLFNYGFAKRYDNVVVVEGVKKALKLVNSVATLGKGISIMQKQLIQRWKHITLILDGEDKTQELAREIQQEFISNGRACVNIDLRKYGFHSPDETTTEQLQTIIQQEYELLRRA